MTLRMLEAGSSEYSDGGTVVTVSGTMVTGTGATGGGGGAEEANVAAAGADGVADAPTLEAAAAPTAGAERLAAQPSFPRNWMDGRLANLTAVDSMVMVQNIMLLYQRQRERGGSVSAGAGSARNRKRKQAT
mmetsp:Transcript_35922/g.86707  ORF Transcript_35922/g.86707 Transcript_35922/m.86707 type:complete len:132 (+) Transcript_35922:1884-2279(+)